MTTTAKCRPILFSGTMVRALLEGRKTQTRRTLRNQPDDGWRPDRMCEIHKMVDGDFPLRNGSPIVLGWGAVDDSGEYGYVCPYGMPGDRLIVRESWRTAKACDGQSPKTIAEKCLDANYRKPWAPIKYEADGATDNADVLSNFGGWGQKRVSIYMPHWASRITLEITDVRVEKLQSISEADKLAEGATPEIPFGTVWKRINTKPGSRWEDSPWVWCVSFRRIVD